MGITLNVRSYVEGNKSITKRQITVYDSVCTSLSCLRVVNVTETESTMVIVRD